MLVGYARVSTVDQNLDSQIDALKVAGCEKVFREKMSGRWSMDRSALADAVRHCSPGDCIVVVKLDRLGRSTRNLLEFVADLEARGIEFQSLGDSIDTRSAMGRFFFTIMSALGELECDRLRERTIAGLVAAKRRGRQGGRPRAITDKQALAAKVRLDAGESWADVARSFNVNRSTLYRAIIRAGEGAGALRK